MVLVLDDMCNGEEISVRGLCGEMIDRMERLGLCVVPPEAERRSDEALWRKWSRWGVFDFHSHVKPQPICYAAAFDPDGFKRVANAMVAEAKVDLRLHSWFSRAIVEDGRIVGVVCETKSGRQAIMGKIVVDATGDLDVAASAGAPFTHGSYIVTTVFRLGGVDIEAAERFEYEEPDAFSRDRSRSEADHGRLLGQMVAEDAAAGHRLVQLPAYGRPRRRQGRGPDARRFPGARAHRRAGRLRARKDARASRTPSWSTSRRRSASARRGLLDGVYVMTKEDVTQRRHFADSVARGRDYYYPYRTLLPRGVGQIAGRGPALFRDLVGAAGFARDSALHGDGRGGGRRRRAGARSQCGRRPTSMSPLCRRGCARRAPIPATGPPPTLSSAVAAE